MGQHSVQRLGIVLCANGSTVRNLEGLGSGGNRAVAMAHVASQTTT